MNRANLYGGGDGGVCVCSRMRVRAYVGMRACVMCLQYTIINWTQADNDNNYNYYPIFHKNQTH